MGVSASAITKCDEPGGRGSQRVKPMSQSFLPGVPKFIPAASHVSSLAPDSWCSHQGAWCPLSMEHAFILNMSPCKSLLLNLKFLVSFLAVLPPLFLLSSFSSSSISCFSTCFSLSSLPLPFLLPPLPLPLLASSSTLPSTTSLGSDG